MKCAFLSLAILSLLSCSSPTHVSPGGRATASAEAPSSDDARDDDDASLPIFSNEEAKALLNRASIMEDESGDVASRDVARGPSKGAFAPDETVECTYAETERVHPKINCTLPDGDRVAVKFDTQEIPGEIFASRLLWALGFPADRNYPVARVRCLKCPEKPKLSHDHIVDEVILDYALIERKYPGKKIRSEAQPEAGWSFRELDDLEGEAGGATRAQADALKLLMVLLQHWDNKSTNNRFVCPKREIHRGDDGKVTCLHPMLLVQDLGSVLGKGGLSVHFPKLRALHVKALDAPRSSRVNYEDWKHQKIWRDGNACHGDLLPYMNGKLKHPRIHEGGRKLLADLLGKLTPKQKHDLFAIAGVQKFNPKVTLDQWVAAFDDKIAQIRDRRCPN